MGLGCLIMFSGVLGLFRFPDVYMRLHSSTKVNTGGAILILLGVIIQTGITFLSLKILLMIGIIVILTPFASHAIGRSAHLHHMNPLIPFESYPSQKYYYDLTCFKRKDEISVENATTDAPAMELPHSDRFPAEQKQEDQYVCTIDPELLNPAGKNGEEHTIGKKTNGNTRSGPAGTKAFEHEDRNVTERVTSNRTEHDVVNDAPNGNIPAKNSDNDRNNEGDVERAGDRK